MILFDGRNPAPVESSWTLEISFGTWGSILGLPVILLMERIQLTSWGTGTPWVRWTAGTYSHGPHEKKGKWSSTKPPWGHVPAVNLPGCSLIITFMYHYCPTVDGRNPANQLRLVVYPMIYDGFFIYTSQVVGLGISEPSPVPDRLRCKNNPPCLCFKVAVGPGPPFTWENRRHFWQQLCPYHPCRVYLPTFGWFLW